MNWCIILLIVTCPITKQSEDVDFGSCDHRFYDEVYEDEEYEDEEYCHRSEFPTETLEERLFPGVQQCCTFHGYMQEGNCNDKV